jgi:hypothetical protein
MIIPDFPDLGFFLILLRFYKIMGTQQVEDE